MSDSNDSNGMFHNIQSEIVAKATDPNRKIALTDADKNLYVAVKAVEYLDGLRKETAEGFQNVAAAQNRMAAAIEAQARALDGIKTQTLELNANFHKYFATPKQPKAKWAKLFDVRTIAFIMLATGVAMGKWGDMVMNYFIVNNK